MREPVILSVKIFLHPAAVQSVDLRIEILTDAADAGVPDAMQLMCVHSAKSYQIPVESARCFSQRFSHGMRASGYDKKHPKPAVRKVYFLHSLKVARAWPPNPAACRS